MSKTIPEVINLLDELFGDYCAVGISRFRNFAEQNKLIFASGETRYCIFDPTWNIVLKIARFDNTEDDYNEIEYENYQVAKKMGIEKILLPIYCVETLKCGVKVYAQIRYSFSHSDIPNDRFRKMLKQTENVSKGKIFSRSYHNCFNRQKISSDWYKRAYQIYGKQFMRKFEKFTHERQINDLHTSNVGYLGKRPIILDFAGYHEENGW